MQNIPHQLQVLWLVICLFGFTDKILTNMVYITNRFSNMKPTFTQFIIHTLILYTANFYCYCVILKLCLKNTVRLYFLCVCYLYQVCLNVVLPLGEKRSSRFFLYSLGKQYKNYVYLSFRMFLINRDSP